MNLYPENCLYWETCRDSGVPACIRNRDKKCPNYYPRVEVL